MDVDGFRRNLIDFDGVFRFCGLADSKLCRISGLRFLAEEKCSNRVNLVNLSVYLRLARQKKLEIMQQQQQRQQQQQQQQQHQYYAPGSQAGAGTRTTKQRHQLAKLRNWRIRRQKREMGDLAWAVWGRMGPASLSPTTGALLGWRRRITADHRQPPALLKLSHTLHV